MNEVMESRRVLRRTIEAHEKSDCGKQGGAE
jgi:hypothetical protein